MHQHRYPFSIRSLIAPVVALGLALAGVWWAFPEGMPFWRSVSIVAAWAGSGLLVASLVFMVRDPHVASFLGGLDTMYRWHHRSGVIAYFFLLCHPLALAMAGWSESPGTAWQMLSPWGQSWPVWFGWASLLLLMTGLMTTLGMRLPYRRWRTLHYLLGLGVLSGLTHIYALFSEVGPPLALIALAAVALGWRLIASDLGVAAYPYRVSKVVPRTAQMIEVTLEPRATTLRVSPGQFVLAAFGDGLHYRGCDEFHPFTVSGIGADGTLNVSVKALGTCTRRIQALEPGVMVHLQGPFGAFLEHSAAASQLWVAGGVGITPFVAALRHKRITQPTTMLYLYRTESEAAFLDELNAFAQTIPEFELISEASRTELPNLEGLLAQVGQLSERQVHICGPPAMVEALTMHLRQRGVSTASIEYEAFDLR